MKNIIFGLLLICILLISCQKKSQNINIDFGKYSVEVIEGKDFVPAQIVQNKEKPNSYEYDLGKYNILQYRANIRTEPNRNSDIIEVLKLNDEIEIIENSGIEELINDVWGFWYKIKYKNIIGYTFGGNIAIKTFVTDIDNNGIDDYFHFRFINRLGLFESNKDIFIYINNERINTTTMNDKIVYSEEPFYIFHWCTFKKIDDYVIIYLDRYGRDSVMARTIYLINGNGNIEYLEAMDGWTDYDNEKKQSLYHITKRKYNDNTIYQQYIDKTKGVIILN